MDALLSRLGYQALNMAMRSGLALTSTYAVSQCSRLMKRIDDKTIRTDLKRLQTQLNSKIKVVSPAIDLIEFNTPVEYVYHMEIIEDLDDGRLHGDDHVQDCPFDGIVQSPTTVPYTPDLSRNGAQKQEPYGIEEGDKRPIWQEVLHKARVRLCRTPLDHVFDRRVGTPVEYAYHMEIIEDLDDGHPRRKSLYWGGHELSYEG
ncbi:Ran-specific GTPase-activating protein 30 like [Verticillium longisporum]|nr:Ran-specific GTPase-activating protein 30 like [Verticillium longisporum]